MSSVLKVNEIQHTGGTTALTIDSSGRISHGSPIGFHMKITGTSSTNYSSWGVILGSGGTNGSWTSTSGIAGGWNSGMMNTSTGCFTFPSDGYYFISFAGRFDGFGSTTYHYLDLTKTSGGAIIANQGENRYMRQLESATASDYTALHVSSLVYGESGQEVGWVYVSDSDTTVQVDGDSYISCYKVG